MKCPKCGKDVELQKKQVGLDDNGEPIMNEFAICRDCKKKWNLDKQRQKKSAEAKAKTASEAAPEPAKPEAQAAKPASRPNASNTARPVKPKENGTEERRPRKQASDRPAKAPKRSVDPEETRLGNIPSEKVRKKREAAVKKNYEDMLAADPKKSRPVKKKRPAEESRYPSGSPKSAPRPVQRIPVEEEPQPKFRAFRLILGLLSIAGGAYFGFQAAMAGLDGIASGGKVTTGTAYAILAACILLSGLITLIMRNRLTRFSFILPLLFCAGGGVFTFLNKQDDKWLLYGTIACAVLAVIYLLLTLFGGAKEEDDDDFDDPYDDDYDDDDF